MSTPARLSFSFVSIVLIAAAIVGCGKKEEEPVVLTMPSAAPAPVKAAEDPAPAATPVGAAGTAAAGDTAAAPVAPPPTTDAPKAAPPQPIDGCCSALTAMTKDAKLDAVTKSKATAAAGICNATAPLVKEGKTQRGPALTRIKATMGGSAPSACN